MKLISTVLIILLVSCTKKAEVSPNTSPDNSISVCIQQKIDNFKTNAKPGYSVKQYLFLSDRVYVFDNLSNVVDGTSPVVSSKCDTICWLGGMQGNVSCLGVNFYDSATEEKTIYLLQ